MASKIAPSVKMSLSPALYFLPVQSKYTRLGHVHGNTTQTSDLK
jgi:hypothetical protein